MAFGNLRIVYNAIKKYGTKSVFVKGFFIMSLFVFLLLVGGIMLFFWFSSDIYDNKTTESLSTELYSTRNRFDSITGMIDSFHTDLQEKNDLPYLAANDKEALTALLKSERQSLSFLNSIYCYIPDENDIISTSNIYKSGAFEDFLDKSWFQPYKKGEGFFYREFPDIGIITKCFSYVKQVESDRPYFMIYNVDYSNMNLDSSSYENSRLYMISRLDSVIYTTDTATADKDSIRAHAAFFDGMSENELTYVRAHRAMDEITLSVNSKKSDIRLMVVFDRRWIHAVNLWQSLLLLLVSLLISMIVSSFLVTKVYKPFTEIIAFEKTINKTNFDSNNEVNSVLDYVMDITVGKQDIEGKLAQNALLLQNTQVSALQAQLNPHFLFNTLQLLNGIILAEAKRDTQAVLVISLISKLLREAIDVSEFFRPFSKEREIAEVYLEIQRIRYPGRFDVLWETDEKTESLRVPKSILQPLLENAIAYGILRIKEKGVIRISTFLKDDIFYISVHDNGPGFEPEKIAEINEILTGKKRITKKNIGLYNVNQRIKVLFGEQFGLQIVSKRGGEVIIRLPAEPYQSTDQRGIEEVR